MNTHVYSVFKDGFDSLWHDHNFLGPEKETIVGPAFLGFYVPHYGDYGDRFVVFQSPVALGEEPKDGMIIKYWVGPEWIKVTKIFNANTILRKLFPYIEDVWEHVDPKTVQFEEFLPWTRIQNTAWKY